MKRLWLWVTLVMLPVLLAVCFAYTAIQQWRAEYPSAAAQPAVTVVQDQHISVPMYHPSAVRPSHPATTASPTPTPSATKPVASSVLTPIWVGIPSIGVAANIKPIRLFSGGVLEPPPSPLVGWWSQRGRPGSADTTYLTGHTIGGKYGIFGKLGSVPVGAKIMLVARDAHGRTYRLTYIVTASFQKPIGWQGTTAWGIHPNTLVATTCTDYQGGGNYTQTRYLIARLISS